MEEIGAHNRDRFDAPDAVREYQQLTGLTPCEHELFERHIPVGARIVDLGVGTGRTTPWLAERGATYLGIDYAPAMVAAAQAAHPNLDLQVGDAADLAMVADQAADVVVFSFNGIDYLDDGARRQALGEIRRVLRPQGTYLFSTHNPRAVVSHLPATDRPLPQRLAAATVMTGRRARRLLPSAPFRTGEGWILDPTKGGLRTHVATPARVAAELAGAGFVVVDQLGSDHPAPARSWRTPWWYYACRVS